MIDRARELLYRFVSFFRRRQRDKDFEAELAAHLELAELDFRERGMSAAESRRAALVSFGSRESAKELHRDGRGLPLLDTLLRDVRFSVRTLRRDASLATFAILIIGLGVGASTTVFSVARALILRPLPFEQASQLVWVANGESTNLSSQTVQVNNLVDFRTRSQTLSDVAGFFAFYGAGDIRVSGAGEPQRLTGVPVTENFFRILGTTMHLGREFSLEEYKSGAPTVILSHRLWQRQFNSNPGVLGQQMSLNSAPATIVGVLPASFDFSAIFTPGEPADLFMPYPLTADHNRQGNTLALIGRLRDGADLATAQAEATLLAQQIESENPRGQRNDFHPRLSALREHVSGEFRQALLVLAGAVGLIMLIVCANLSNLLLARARTRRREMAIHVALGAGRPPLIRRMLVESVLLACCGAVLGLALAVGGTAMLTQVEGTNIPLLYDVRIDRVALGFTFVLALLTGVGFAITPALRASATAPAQTLRESGRSFTEGRESGWMRSSLVVCEIALACILLTAVGLLTRSLVHVLETDLGFETENVLALRVDPDRNALNPEQRAAYLDQVLGSARAVAGVEAAGLTDALPLGDNFGWRTWSVSAIPKEEVVSPLIRIVDDGYFSVMKIPLRAGRLFTAADLPATQPVALVNQTLARRLWPDRAAVGRSIRTSGHEYQVVGVVSEARYFTLERDSGAEMYLPIRQMPDYNSLDLVVRTTGSPIALAPSMRQALRAVDPSLPTSDFRTMQQLVNRSTFSRRAVVLLLSGFAGFGLLLASVGIYGLISYSVRQRTQEMGVRMALGATPSDLRRSIVRQTVRPALIGIALGTIASWLVAHGLQGLLYGVTSTDPLTYVAVMALLAASAALASYVPARRTSRLNVVEALRFE